jgi:hypothetical protein
MLHVLFSHPTTCVCLALNTPVDVVTIIGLCNMLHSCCNIFVRGTSIWPPFIIVVIFFLGICWTCGDLLQVKITAVILKNDVTTILKYTQKRYIG